MKYNFIKKIKEGEFSLVEEVRQIGKDMFKFYKGIKANKSELLSIATAVFFLGCLLEIHRLYTHPHFSDVSNYRGSSSITFRDNLAPGMKAFVKYTDRNRNVVFRDNNGEWQVFDNPSFNKEREIEMSPSYKDANFYSFSIPQPALKEGKFVVYAIDREGNKSKPKTLHTLEGIVVENSPN